MQNNDLTQKIQDVFGKMDKKTIQDNINKAIDILKNGNPEVLAKQISSAIKNQQEGAPSGIDKSSLEKLNIDPEMLKKLEKTDIEKLLKNIGSHDDGIKNKIKDTIK